jgi:PAS domain S-box-containing protein
LLISGQLTYNTTGYAKEVNNDSPVGDALISQNSRYSHAVLIIAILITALASYQAHKNHIGKIETEFRNQAMESHNLIDQRINLYIEVIRSMRSVYAASNEVTRKEWKEYTESLDIWNRYPGILALNFNRLVTSGGKEEFVQKTRNDRSIDPRGYPDFAIRPAGERESYLVVDYIEPLENNMGVHGYDTSSEPTRKAATERTIGSGELTLSGEIKLVQGGTGFLIHYPVYRNGLPVDSVAQRRKAFSGFITGVFRVDDLMKGALGNRLEGSIKYEIYDISEQPQGGDGIDSGIVKLLYNSVDEKPDSTMVQNNRLGITKELKTGGRVWNIHFHPKDDAASALMNNPGFGFMVGGTAIALLLFWLVKSLEQRLRAEKTARNMENRFSVIAENSNELIWELDTNGNYTYVSPVIENFIGIKPTQVIGRHHSEFFHPDDRASLKKITSEALSKKEPFRGFVNRHIHKDGTSIFLNFSGIPIIGDNGNLLGFRGIGRNTTKTKLTEEKLRIAKESAEEANQMKSDFIANISHELNTPLSSILGFTKLLLKTELDKEQRKFIEVVDKCSERLFSLINEILELTNAVHGSSELADNLFNPRMLIETYIGTVTKEVETKGVTLCRQIGADLPMLLRGDDEKLHHIMRMIISNAIKFTDSGEIVIDVSVDKTDPDSSTLHFSVKDSGIGIPPDKQEIIFESFKQLDGSITRKYGGIGIGLATSKRLVELMGGTLWFDSKVGDGTTFHFLIPFKKA